MAAVGPLSAGSAAQAPRTRHRPSGGLNGKHFLSQSVAPDAVRESLLHTSFTVTVPKMKS